MRSIAVAVHLLTQKKTADLAMPVGGCVGSFRVLGYITRASTPPAGRPAWPAFDRS
jgi:hypothetical protein